MFYAYKGWYKHNDCVLKTKQTFAICTKQNFIKPQNFCVPIYIDLFVVKWMLLFFFEVFINRLPKIHRSVLRKITIDLLYFWDVYDVNLWQKLAITVKLCIIETRLKQGYDLQSYLVKTTRETINVLAIAEVFCKKGVFKIWKKLQQKPCACGL